MLFIETYIIEAISHSAIAPFRNDKNGVDKFYRCVRIHCYAESSVTGAFDSVLQD